MILTLFNLGLKYEVKFKVVFFSQLYTGHKFHSYMPRGGDGKSASPPAPPPKLESTPFFNFKLFVVRRRNWISTLQLSWTLVLTSPR